MVPVPTFEKVMVPVPVPTFEKLRFRFRFQLRIYEHGIYSRGLKKLTTAGEQKTTQLYRTKSASEILYSRKVEEPTSLLQHSPQQKWTSLLKTGSSTT
jgi:hypothetical protein